MRKTNHATGRVAEVEIAKPRQVSDSSKTILASNPFHGREAVPPDPLLQRLIRPK
jgi:hypothetical protein